jgi:hypothetical protein
VVDQAVLACIATSAASLLPKNARHLRRHLTPAHSLLNRCLTGFQSDINCSGNRENMPRTPHFSEFPASVPSDDRRPLSGNIPGATHPFTPIRDFPCQFLAQGIGHTKIFIAVCMFLLPGYGRLYTALSAERVSPDNGSGGSCVPLKANRAANPPSAHTGLPLPGSFHRNLRRVRGHGERPPPGPGIT